MNTVTFNNYNLSFRTNFNDSTTISTDFMFHLIELANNINCDDPTKKQLVISAINKVIDENLNPILAKAFSHFEKESLNMLIDVYVCSTKNRRIEDFIVKGKKIDPRTGIFVSDSENEIIS